jgi:hypothetical protein
MGNRAVITNSKAYDVANSTDLGVYLHWNGGVNSVRAFLKYCELKGYRSPDEDNYGWARLCQVIGNFFGGGLSVGIDKCCNLDCDNYDNGTYIIKRWEIVDRKYEPAYETDDYDLYDMLKEIDSRQPVSEQLGDFLDAEEIPIEEVKVGDVVFFFNDIDNKYEKRTVVGIGEEVRSSWVKTLGVPYVNRYGSEDKGYAWNCNNYIKGKTVRVCR